MVDSDTRNNLIVVVLIVAVAVIVAAFIGIFAQSILQVADKGQSTIDKVGKSVAGNISESTQTNQLNLLQFNKSMADIVKSNDRVLVANNESLANLTRVVHNFSESNAGYLSGVKNNTGANTQTIQALLKEQKHTSALLENISKQLKIVPVTPISTPNPTQNKTCNIYSPGFPFCILPPTHPIFDILTGNKTINSTTH